jgi:carboxyl-terminal processing protease
MSQASRRAVRGATLVGVVAAAYGGGVATGVLGSAHDGPDDGSASAAVSIVDQAEARIETRAARTVDTDTLQRAAVEGMLRALGDRWSTYYPPSQFASFQDALDGRYTGVGLWLREGSQGHVVVGSVQGGTPAAQAGIAVGDQIVSLDGTDVAGQRVADVAAHLRGANGSAVTLGIRGVTGTRTVTVRRSTLVTDDVSVERLPGHASVIRVAEFSRGVGRQVRLALAGDKSALQGGVVLDLRGNPGGLLDEAVEVASAFLDGGPVVSYERRGSGVQTLDAIGTGDTVTPVAVLVDGGTASAAEVVAAALQDRNRAVVVGSRTFGKGSVQEPSTLSDGSALELTVGKYRTPAGRMIDGVGVTPDVNVDPAATGDVAQARAVEVLGGLVAALDTSGRG